MENQRFLEDPAQYQVFDRGADGPWKQPIEVDKTILMPKATSRKVRVTIPTYEEKEVATAVFDEQGNPVLTEEGFPLYRKERMTVFTGFVDQELKLPGEEVFQVDLTSSYLTNEDVVAIRNLISLYSDVQLQILRGKDRVADAYYIYNKIFGMVNTAKSRDGKTARLAKTSISEGSSKQQIIDEYRQEKERSRWLPGNM